MQIGHSCTSLLSTTNHFFRNISCSHKQVSLKTFNLVYCLCICEVYFWRKVYSHTKTSDQKQQHYHLKSSSTDLILKLTWPKCLDVPTMLHHESHDIIYFQHIMRVLGSGPWSYRWIQLTKMCQEGRWWLNFFWHGSASLSNPLDAIMSISYIFFVAVLSLKHNVCLITSLQKLSSTYVKYIYWNWSCISMACTNGLPSWEVGSVMPPGECCLNAMTCETTHGKGLWGVMGVAQ